MKYGNMPRNHEEVIFNKLVAAANGDESILMKIVRGVVKITLTVVSYLVAKYTQLVKYSRTIEQLVKAGNYDYANPDITSKNFPSSEEGNKDVEFGLFHFNRDISSDDSIEGMKAEGYRPATAKETLSFGEKNPKLQLEYPIVGLGSVVELDGDRQVVYLIRNGSNREARLYYYDDDWHDSFRFLGVRI
jgi:hypothetical protein